MTNTIYTTDSNINIVVKDNEFLVINHYIYNKDSNVCINLSGINAKVEYHLSVINEDNHKCRVVINHNNKKTVSKIYNHGINVFKNNLIFDIVGNIFENSDDSILIQENQIINLSDGYGQINPILIIDNYNSISNHSAYIGEFKKEYLFYLMSRGIDYEYANYLLAKSFLNIKTYDEFIVKEFKNKLKEVI